MPENWMDKRAKKCYDALMAKLSSSEDKELLMNVWHDVWHMGHSKGWTDAKSVYSRRLDQAFAILKELGHEHRWRDGYISRTNKAGNHVKEEKCDCGAEREVPDPRYAK